MFAGIFKFLDEYYESLKREEEKKSEEKEAPSPTPSTTSAHDQKYKKEKRSV